MKCQGCGEELPYDIEAPLFDGEIEQVVKWRYTPDDQIATVETAGYCSRQCAVDDWGLTPTEDRSQDTDTE
jgi:hypothetical protein